MENIETSSLGQPDFDLYQNQLESYNNPNIVFHPTGILDKEIFDAVVLSPSVELDGDVPISVNVSEATELVASDRCINLAKELVPDINESDIKVALFPLEHVISNVDKYRAQHFQNGNQSPLILFAEDNGSVLPEIDASKLTVHNLINPQTNTAASINLFEAINYVTVDDSMSSTDLVGAFNEARVSLMEATEDGGQIIVQRGGRFSEDEEKLLWQLFSTRFQDISANMPVSLEENEQSTTENIFRNPSYMFIYTSTPEGLIDCCAFITDNRESYPWISEQYLDIRNKVIGDSQNGQELYELFVPGIAARRDTRKWAANAALTKMTQLVVATNNPLPITRFESTDVSSLYVPRLVNNAINACLGYDKSEMQKLGEKRYVAVELRP